VVAVLFKNEKLVAKLDIQGNMTLRL